MNSWYSSLNQREQLSLLLLAAAVGMYLAYVLVWSPLASSRDELIVRNQSVASSLLRVDAMVSEVLLLRESGAGNSSKRNLTALINQSTSRMNLQVSRLQPNSRGELQVRLENASFDDVLAWLYEMEYSQGLLVREVSLTSSGSAGRVNASIRLAQGG
ncbi:MAG: type II secretion system protein M [Proteobacteria bacterium]|nr:type II secretion system protein M [Pseudomonadota bacterium]